MYVKVCVEQRFQFEKISIVWRWISSEFLKLLIQTVMLISCFLMPVLKVQETYKKV